MPVPIRVHQNARRSVADVHTFEFLARCCFVNDEIAVAQARNQHQLSIRSELQPVCAERLRVQSGCYFPAFKIDHRQRAVLGICRPQFVSIG